MVQAQELSTRGVYSMPKRKSTEVGTTQQTSDKNKKPPAKLHAKAPGLVYGMSLAFLVQLIKKTIEEEAALSVEHKQQMQQAKKRKEYENDLALMSMAFSLLKQDLGGTIDFSKVNVALVLAYGRAALADGLPNNNMAHEVLKLAKQLHAAKQEHNEKLSPILQELQAKRPQLMPTLLRTYKQNQTSLKTLASKITGQQTDLKNPELAYKGLELIRKVGEPSTTADNKSVEPAPKRPKLTMNPNKKG